MTTETYDSVIAAIGRLEEGFQNLKDLIIEVRNDGKERRAETQHLLERLDSKVDSEADHRRESDALMVEIKRELHQAMARIADLEAQFKAALPHIETMKAATEDRKDRQNGLLRPLWIGAVGGSIASFALVLGEAFWAFVNSHFLHWGG